MSDDGSNTGGLPVLFQPMQLVGNRHVSQMYIGVGGGATNATFTVRGSEQRLKDDVKLFELLDGRPQVRERNREGEWEIEEER